MGLYLDIPCMVGWYFEAGRGHTATSSGNAKYMMQNYGGGQSERDLLANREHLTAVRHCEEASYDFTFAELEALLRRFGPIFF